MVRTEFFYSIDKNFKISVYRLTIVVKFDFDKLCIERFYAFVVIIVM